MNHDTERAARWAGAFYPDDPQALTRQLKALFAAARPHQTDPAIAVMVPHAGYAYSGRVAAETLARVECPPRVILIGPRHRRGGAPFALSPASRWRTPLGPCTVDAALSEALANALPELRFDALAHRDEHSLEVIVPLLQHLRPDVHIVPVLVGGGLSAADCQRWGRAIAEVLASWPTPTLLIASSDMHHQGIEDTPSGTRPAAVVRRLDRLAYTPLDALDPGALIDTCRAHQIRMCGVQPTAIVMSAAVAMGARRAVRDAATDSETVTGTPSNWVVGYAGYRFLSG